MDHNQNAADPDAADSFGLAQKGRGHPQKDTRRTKVAEGRRGCLGSIAALESTTVGKDAHISNPDAC